ncbi:hypothetical protein FN846DRAFT_968118 [Sphaerosporella brunnea]|uniref:Zn(2)-C6 fungal-type domain-containing protein n=1 Tax=Sphaerosporella brunnea TaxID=1250544 RepID=A0A5J5EL61_9PEZI|nr:hypothetical protein FN846DRAFT_968118 [Sphaerosporella brunnea]
MAPRRSHKKSRTGCQRCKKRRIKCDEVHPACGNCVKHAIVCDFSLSPDEIAAAPDLQPVPRRPRAVGTSSPAVASAISNVSPPPPAQQVTTSSNLPTLEMMVSLPSPSPSHVHHHPSPGAQDNNGHIRAPTVSPLTPASSLVPSPAPTDGLLLGVKQSPTVALPPRSPSLSTSSFATSNQPVLPPFNPVPLTTSTLNVLDLSLMHHWSTSTWDTISNHPTIQVLWRINIPVLAVHHPFLMHALLAIAALHLQSTEADHSKGAHYITAAAHHHEHAVRGMAATLAHLSRENCDALVVTACLVVIYSFVSSRIEDAQRPLDAGRIASWVPLLRGVHSILKQAWSWVTGGPLSPLIRQYELSSATEGLDPETEGLLQSLYRLCTDRSLPGSEELSDTTTSTAYFSAIAELRKSFVTISQWESVIGSIFVWPITAADKYVELLESKRPRALVIFMHYCALFTLVEEFWWNKGSALFELRRCEACLSEEWLPWIQWPRMRILSRDVDIVTGRG